MKTMRREDLLEVKELRIDKTKVTATAAELNALDGITATVAELNILDGVTRTYGQINALIQGIAAGYKIARIHHTTVAASDDVDTGLASVVAAVGSLDSDPVLDPLWVSVSIGNQSDAPAAGHVYVKTWQPVATNDVTPTPASTFSKLVNVLAIGT